MAALELDLLRVGALWCEDDNNLFPAGYYEVQGGYLRPPGRPKVRPWRLSLRASPRPFIVRQAESDNANGTDQADSGFIVEEGVVVAFTATTSQQDVIDQANVAGAEKFNLAAGMWHIYLRVRATNANTAFQVNIYQNGGALIQSSGDKTAGSTGAYVEVDMGVFTIPEANAGTNHYTLTARATSGTQACFFDRIRVVPV